MVKKRRIPSVVFEIVGKRFGLKKNTIKMRIYRNDLTIIEAVKSEMDKLTANEEKAKIIKAGFYNTNV